MASRQHCTSSRSSEAISSQRPVTDNVSLSLYNDAFDQDLHVVPLQRHVQQRKLRKKRGKASPKVKCTSAFYKRNVWRHNSSIHLTAKCVDVAYSPLVSDDDSDIVALSDNDIILPGRDTPYSPLVSDDDSDIAALSDNDIILPGRDTPYSPPVSDEDPDTESDDSTADLFAQLYELYPDAE